MFKFGGWKASLNFGGPSRRREVYENGPDLSVGGAYRVHREEFFGRDNLLEPPKKLTPSMVKLPPSKEALKSSKSANDLTNSTNLPPDLRKSTPDVSTDPRGGTNNRDSSDLRNAKSKSSKDERRESKKQEKERKEAEKKQLAEQKKRDKLAKQEQAKQEKLRIQQDGQAQKAKDGKIKKGPEKSKKNAPPAPLPQASVTKATLPPIPVPESIPQPPQPPQRSSPLGQQTRYSTNTLESSISRSSGPPPYSESPKPPEKQPNKKDATGNTSFSKPIENSSWDLISEHRNQMSRNPVAGGSRSKQMVMDLQFSFDRAQNNDDKNNSDV